jgi:glycerophosphoryl diester phosphodiesterase
VTDTSARPRAGTAGRSERSLLRVGHKGADAIAPGNTLESFAAAVEAGVDVVELDVLRPQGDFAEGGDWRRAPAGPATGSGPLLVAHDWGDARRRDPITLGEALGAFTRPSLDAVELDLDLKIAGREDEVIAAVREHGLLARAMVSTMEIGSLRFLRDAEPALRRGWTYPRVTRPWDRKPWARPIVLGSMALMRRRLPQRAGEMIRSLGASAIWIYNPLATADLARACEDAGIDLIAWTVDDVERMRELVAIGVTGLCTNDPRLFGEL